MSVTGKCENVKTLQDCVNLCNENCDRGYFIETPNSDNICLPLDSIYFDIDSSPYYHIRNQEFKNSKSTIFIKDRYKYPPDDSNVIFYLDNLQITNIKSGESIGIENEGKIKVLNTISEKKVNLHFIPNRLLDSNMNKHLPVKNGDNIIINIPSTSYVLNENNGNIIWNLNILSNSYFKIFAKNKNFGNILTYDDEIYFMYQDKYIGFDNQNLSLSDQINDYVYFKLEPQILVYYCDKKCTAVELKYTETNNEIARYKNMYVTRNPSCWNTCNSRHGKKIPIFLFIFLLICFCLLLFFSREKV
jgi:hypothetical protein